MKTVIFPKYLQMLKILAFFAYNFFNFELYLKSLSFFLLENFCQENKQIVLVLGDKFVQVPRQVHLSFQIFEINQLW